MIPRFRVWVKEKKEMHSLVSMNFHTGKLYQVITDYPSRKPWDPLPEHHPEDVVIMQATNYRDRNGREIYEGDVIRTLDNYLDIVDTLEYAYISLVMDSTVVEIVGNIYENPELEKGAYGHDEPQN